MVFLYYGIGTFTEVNNLNTLTSDLKDLEFILLHM